MLFGIDAVRRAIWRRDLKLYEAGLKAGEEKGYQRGYDARVAEEELQQNGRGSRTGRRRRRTLRDDH